MVIALSNFSIEDYKKQQLKEYLKNPKKYRMKQVLESIVCWAIFTSVILSPIFIEIIKAYLDKDIAKKRYQTAQEGYQIEKQRYQMEFNIRYNQVMFLADKNSDGITNRKDWVGVYRKLGIGFDEYSDPRKDLLLSDLERYLSNF